MTARKHKIGINSGFFISWLITFIYLYALSYTWHGVILNDLNRVTYPIELFLLFVAIVYFVVSFGINLLILLFPYIESKALKGLVIGAPVGVFIYLIAFVFGISFYSNPTLSHILFDLAWQVVEQSSAGFLAGGLLGIFAMAKKHAH
ncbi:MAG: hypothetical protein KDC83_12210 [Flavobacteriales bacterium]|nr:hypothetical protein [Flavobacteriales bacterium]